MVNADLHLPSLSIQGFRGIEALEIPRLGRVNLITGKNNTGKSSILEALRIFTQNAAPHVIQEILRYREEYSSVAGEEERAPDPESLFQVSSLFHGFPKFLESSQRIGISTGGASTFGNGTPKWLKMYVDWVHEERAAARTGSAATPRHISEDSFGALALVVKTEDGERFHLLERLLSPAVMGRLYRARYQNSYRMPCILVSSFGSEGTATLGPMWDEVVLTPFEKEVVKALHIIDPQISATAMVGDEGTRRPRKAIVRTENIDHPVPLRSFGDGLNRLFAIILSLVDAKGGILLVDEFENGLHHTVQLDAWRMIFRLAQELNIQVFATSHSKDALSAFQEAAAETPEDGMLIRLTRRGENIIPTVFGEDELAVITRDHIEVR